MDRSTSEPTLRNEDYFVPANGIGDTGHASRVILGPFSKDTGEHSNRVNLIIKQAAKAPGPDKYLAHQEWSANGYKFANTSRSWKQMNKLPAPSHYESKDFMTTRQLGARDNLSQNRRTLGGKLAQGRRGSFLDQAIKHGERTPGPGHFNPKQKSSNRLDTAVKGNVDYLAEGKTNKGNKPPVKQIGPDHYHPDFKHIDKKLPNWTVPKEPGNNFIDKQTRDKMVDKKSKKEMPGPGTYPTHEADFNKVSRGTMHTTLRGISRSAISGYM